MMCNYGHFEEIQYNYFVLNTKALSIMHVLRTYFCLTIFSHHTTDKESIGHLCNKKYGWFLPQTVPDMVC